MNLSLVKILFACVTLTLVSANTHAQTRPIRPDQGWYLLLSPPVLGGLMFAPGHRAGGGLVIGEYGAGYQFHRSWAAELEANGVFYSKHFGNHFEAVARIVFTPILRKVSPILTAGMGAGAFGSHEDSSTYKPTGLFVVGGGAVAHFGQKHALILRAEYGLTYTTHPAIDHIYHEARIALLYRLFL